MVCSIDGCSRPAGVPGSARGWCRAHYRRWQRYGTPHEPQRRTYTYGGLRCFVLGCANPINARGLCYTHAKRLRDHGLVEPSPFRRVKGKCGCGAPLYSLDRCRLHYDRVRRPSKPQRKSPRRERMRAYREANPEKIAAQQALNAAVRRGEIVRGLCEVCGSANVHGHHDDYAKPLDVRWLCPDDHAREHAA